MSSSKPQSREPLTTRQRSILMAFYNENPYPSSSERRLLVQLTGRTIKQVQDWFSNRRRTDSRLVSTSSTINVSPPQMAIQPVYYSSPPPPYSTCSYCSQLPSYSPNPVYDCPTIYYPPLNHFHT